MSRLARPVLLAGAWMSFACAAPADQPKELPPPHRQSIPVTVDTAWVVREADDRRVLRYPLALTLTPDAVVILDVGHKQLLALSRANGRVLWRGTSDRELSEPRAIATLPSSGILVLDAQPGTLRRFDRLGRELASWDHSVFKDASSLCPTSVTTVLISSLNADTSIYEVDLERRTVRGVPFPFAAAAHAHQLVRQGRFAAGTGSQCSYLLTLASRFAIFDADSVETSEYVEQLPEILLERRKRDELIDGSDASVEEVRVVRPVLATMTGSLDGKCLRVLFEGRTAEAGRLLDEYSVASGRYLSTLVLPRRIGDFVMIGDTIFALGRVAGLAQVQRLHLTPTAPHCGR